MMIETNVCATSDPRLKTKLKFIKHFLHVSEKCDSFVNPLSFLLSFSLRLFVFLELAISTHFTLIYRSITKRNVRFHHGLSKQPFSNSSGGHSGPQSYALQPRHHRQDLTEN